MSYVDIAIRGVGRREQFTVNATPVCVTAFSTNATGDRPTQRQAVHIFIDPASSYDCYFVAHFSSTSAPTMTTVRASVKMTAGQDRILHADLNTHIWCINSSSPSANNYVEVVEYK